MRRLIVGALAAAALLFAPAQASATSYADADYISEIWAAINCGNYAQCNGSYSWDPVVVGYNNNGAIWVFRVTWQGLWTVPGNTYQCWARLRVWTEGYGWRQHMNQELGWNPGGGRVCGYL